LQEDREEEFYFPGRSILPAFFFSLENPGDLLPDPDLTLGIAIIQKNRGQVFPLLFSKYPRKKPGSYLPLISPELPCGPGGPSPHLVKLSIWGVILFLS